MSGDPKGSGTAGEAVVSHLRHRVSDLEADNKKLKDRLMILEGSNNAANEAIITADQRGKIIVANGAAEAMFGPMVGQDIKSLVLKCVKEPILPRTGVSVVQKMPLPYGFELLARLEDVTNDQVFKEGITERVEIERPLLGDSRDVRISMHYVRDDNGFPFLMHMTLVDIGELLKEVAGLETKGTFERVFKREASRRFRSKQAGREPAPLTMAIIDIDNFKTFNDSYGHLVGDKVIRRVGLLVKGMAKRGGDLAARWAGDEFIVMIEANLGVAEKIISNFLEEVRGIILNAVHKDTKVFEPVFVTVSVGFTNYVTDEDIRSTFERADQALYASKEAGRNRAAHMEGYRRITDEFEAVEVK